MEDKIRVLFGKDYTNERSDEDILLFIEKKLEEEMGLRKKLQPVDDSTPIRFIDTCMGSTVAVITAINLNICLLLVTLGYFLSAVATTSHCPQQHFH